MNYYNEIDPFAVQWLRELIRAGLIPAGDVDERSIEDVLPTDLKPYRQCHFFAGISGWPRALQLAGWPEDCPVWTGSVPCKPFSTAGKRAGFADERHLWPAFFWLIEQCRPPVVFGEQVSTKTALEWWDLVAFDLEGANYATAAADLPASSVGAPHRRDRLFWVAHAESQSRRQRESRFAPKRAKSVRSFSSDGSGQCSTATRMDDSDCQRQQEQRLSFPNVQKNVSSQLSGSACRLEHTARQRRKKPEAFASGAEEPLRAEIWPSAAGANCEASPWEDCEWIDCLDGKRRPIKPQIRLLAHGVPGRVGRLRGYGNSIVPPLAAAFIQAYLEVLAV